MNIEELTPGVATVLAMAEEPLSLRDAARLLGCSHTTVATLLRAGTLADLRPATVEALAASGWRPEPRPGPGRPGTPVYDEQGAPFAPSVGRAAALLGVHDSNVREYLVSYRDGYRISRRPRKGEA